MAQSLTGSVRLIPAFTYTNSLDLETVSSALGSAMNKTASYTNGTGANQANCLWSDTMTLTTATSATLDLENLTNAYGTATFTGVKEILIQVTTATTGYRLEVGAASANQFVGPLKDTSDIEVIGAGGQWYSSSPVNAWTVDGTHSDLKINNPSGGSVTFNILIVGIGTVA